MSDVRAFAKRINKNMTPGEVRSEVSSISESQRQSVMMQKTAASPAPASDDRSSTSGSIMSSGSTPSSVAASTTASAFSTNPLAASSTTSSSLVEVNFEGILAQRQKEVDADKLKSILVVPSDDIVVETRPREFRTVHSPVPAGYDEKAADPVLVACVNSYVSDWNVVNFQNAFNSRRTERADEGSVVLAERTFEVDERDKISSAPSSTGPATSGNSGASTPTLSLTDDMDAILRAGRSSSPAVSNSSPRPGDRNSKVNNSADIIRAEFARLESDGTQPELLKYTVGETDKQNTRARQLDRNRLFVVQQELDPQLERSRYSGDRPEAEPFYERFGTRFVVTPKELSFKLEDIEPFFVSIALYDAQERRKISETFHFELSKDEVKSLVPAFAGPREPTAEARKALFSVTAPHQDIYLVVRIEKILQGDINETSEPYITISDKNTLKAKQSVQDDAKRLGAYRMPWAWSATPLFNSKGELDAAEDLAIRLLFRQEGDKLSEDDLFRYLVEFRKGTVQKKLKAIPGSIIFTAATVDDLPPSVLTTSLIAVAPMFKLNAAELIREVEEFPVHPALVANATYTHHLYVYPSSLNFNNRGATVKARNLACKVELYASDSMTATPLKCIYGKPPGPALVTSSTTAVTYHNKSPDWYEEIKVSLPTKLTEHHHLLFSFYHVSCQPPKKPGTVEPVDTLVGQAFLPLLRLDGRINVCVESIIPVAATLAPNYLADSPDIKWVDGKRTLFKLSTRLVSTVSTQSNELHSFLALSRQPAVADEAVLTSVKQLLKATDADVVQFTSVLLTQLFSILVRPTASENLSRETFRALVHIVNVSHKDAVGLTRNPTLHSFVQFMFENPTNTKKYVFDEIIRLWITFIKENEPSMTDLLKHAWFFFEHAWFFFDVVVKSMVQFLASQKALSKPRADRLPAALSNNIRALLELLTFEIQKRSKSGHTIGKRLNQSVAYFLRDALAFYDRGFILSLVQRHLNETAPNDAEVLLEFKLEFIRILCNYEHYVALNLPLMPKAYNERMLMLTEEYRERHILSGILLNELSLMLEHTEKTLRKRAITTVRDLLAKLDSDERYADAECRARIAALHFPLIHIVLENVKRLATSDNIVDREGVADGTATVRTLTEAQAKELKDGGTIRGTNNATMSVVTGGTFGVAAGSAAVPSDVLDFEETRDLLVCFLHILRDANPELVRFWWKCNKDFPNRILSFFEVLEKSVCVFEYVGKRRLGLRASSTPTTVGASDAKRMLEETYSSLSSRSVQQRSVRSRPQIDNPTLSPGPQRDNSLRRFGQSMQSKRIASDYKLARDVERDARVEGNLSCEVCLTVLDVAEDFVLSSLDGSGGDDNSSEISEVVFKLLMAFLRTNQDRAMYLHIFASLRSFLFKFPELFFQGVTDFCAELVGEVLKLCNSQFAATRTQATAFLYLMMKKNYQFTSNTFSRVKVQATIALSRLVGSGIKINDVFLQRALATCGEYAAQDKEMTASTFAEQVKDLSARLYTILRDTVKMKMHEKDSDMLIDLQYRLAKGYANSPDLRVTWLENMANFHFEKKNWAEAAQCYIHTAALVSEYMHMIEYKKGMPAGCAAFQGVSPNIAEETAVSEDAQSADEEGICESKSFSEAGLVALLEKSISFLKKAEYYETVNEMYKLLLPILEKNRSFEKLAEHHGKLQDIFQLIVGVMQSGKRILGSYYRVGFYGEKFGEQNGKEYIYKEPKITPLAEISLRLQTVYKERFGERNFELITDSVDVDVSKLDPLKAYIQLTYVEPYFTEYELKERVTSFERSNNINRFIYDTPFTESGKARGSIEDQRKRKTILTTEAFFPYLKKRLLIVDRQTVVLTPIEVAIEEIQSKTMELANTVQTKPPNLKMLQLQLQGSVSVTVNSGPLEMANVFLGRLVKDMPTKHVRRLKQQFREFIKYCGQALNMNAELIKPDQVEYQKDLAAKYKDLKAKLAPFLVVDKAAHQNSNPDGDSLDDSTEPSLGQINKVLEIIGSKTPDASRLLSPSGRTPV
ncbi:Dock7 protein [Capsaspora owczarzaki ATCC 30864]|uniref:Dock7 protein n=1 Tax=Capsaspora owczarzaki (strain ATCC 30864) TaxID=595528 RepID=A0A0D2WU43_CAPO3|nr:Dock7 protein [Capsaspora owczarzaki ATCC 30864]KJE96095.1 Dock7 protein [Capsaspora owczarzaki ATCC 30864]|eukprot:XP_004345213.2 Dock7 protein [Capsaspora owczarzaki ATCC 30864]